MFNYIMLSILSGLFGGAIGWILGITVASQGAIWQNWIQDSQPEPGKPFLVFSKGKIRANIYVVSETGQYSPKNKILQPILLNINDLTPEKDIKIEYWAYLDSFHSGL